MATPTRPFAPRLSCPGLPALLLGLGLAAPAHAAPTVHLGVGGVATLQSTGAGPGGVGRLVFEGERFGLEGGVRESAVGVAGDLVDRGLAHSDGSFVGNIHLVGRLPVGPVVLRAGLAHHHETPAPVVAGDPLRALAGTSPGIAHRSGFEAGVEGLWSVAALAPALSGPLVDRLELTAGLAADWMPGAGGPPVTGQAELGIRARLGR